MNRTSLSVILLCSFISLGRSQETRLEPQLSPLAQKFVVSLNKMKPEVLFSEAEICDQTVEEIASIDQKIVILKTLTGLGVSCKGINRSIFFIDGEYKGYYQSDEIYPLKIQSDTLIWTTEGGRKYKMILKSELPQELNFQGLVTIPILIN